MDLNQLMTSIVAFSAVVSPIIVAIINNSHQRKMKKLELATTQKIEKIQYYIRILLNYIDEPTDRGYNSLYKASIEVSVYVSKSAVKEINKANKLLKATPQDYSDDDLERLIHELQKSLGLI